MSGSYRTALCAALACLATVIPWYGACAQDRKATRIVMTVQELAGLGLALRVPGVAPFPNSCGPAGNRRITISDSLLQRFTARGFTLESVCLAVSSSVRFNSETGRPLFIAVVGRGQNEMEFPLSFPACFRNGVPYLECEQRFDAWDGSALKRNETADRRAFAQRLDAYLRGYIQRERVSGPFKPEVLKREELVGSVYEWFLATPALPRGYGYALHGPEGEDPEVENIDLSTFRRRRGAPQPGD